MDFTNIDQLKDAYRRFTNPTADLHTSDDELADLRARIEKADPAWLAAYDTELAAWEADIDASADED